MIECTQTQMPGSYFLDRRLYGTLYQDFAFACSLTIFQKIYQLHSPLHHIK